MYVFILLEPRFGMEKKQELLMIKYMKKRREMFLFFLLTKQCARCTKKRVAAARFCHSNHLADVYGKVIGGNYVDITKTSGKYRFSFAIENNQTDYYFTEIILLSAGIGSYFLPGGAGSVLSGIP